MYIQVVKNGESRKIKERYLKNFLDQGWEPAEAKKTKPAEKIKASAEVKPIAPEEWDMDEDWADSEESVSDNEGEA